MSLANASMPDAKTLLRTLFPAVFLGSARMKPLRPRSNALGNRWRACVCLLALFLLWTPAWAAAYQAHSMACCADGMCPAHGRTPKNPHGTDSQDNPQPGTCEHHGSKAAMDCTMACCHPEAPALAGAVVFLLPAASALAAPLLVVEAAPHQSVLADSFPLDPDFPPPRS